VRSLSLLRSVAFAAGFLSVMCVFRPGLLRAVIPQCPTQPLVTISNITLQNVNMTGGLTLPGVLLLDPANPGVCLWVCAAWL
jgi:hypothetical protein